MGGQNCKKLNIGRDSYDPSQPKNHYLHNSRNLEGQNQSQRTVTYNHFDDSFFQNGQD